MPDSTTAERLGLMADLMTSHATDEFQQETISEMKCKQSWTLLGRVYECPHGL